MTDTFREMIQALPRPLDAAAPGVLPPRDPHVLTRSLARLVKRLGLTRLTFRDLRYDTASNLTMAGVPQHSIIELLGHRDRAAGARRGLRARRCAIDALWAPGADRENAGSHNPAFRNGGRYWT